MIETHGLDTSRLVFFYEHDFYVLSNFASFRLAWKGLDFDTSEHAYHWEKFPDFPDIQAEILASRSAHDAFKIAEKHADRVRDDWKSIRVGVMRCLLRAKADQHEYVRRKLLATGERELIEDSWRDSFWGWGPTKDGQNMLGRLWMEIREAMRASAVAPPTPDPR